MDLKSRLAAIGKPVAPRSRIILILGPHRSGTSLVAKSMTCLGAALGERAEWYGPDNPSGFWEHQDVLAINEAILRRRDVERLAGAEGVDHWRAGATAQPMRLHGNDAADIRVHHGWPRPLSSRASV